MNSISPTLIPKANGMYPPYIPNIPNANIQIQLTYIPPIVGRIYPIQIYIIQGPNLPGPNLPRTHFHYSDKG